MINGIKIGTIETAVGMDVFKLEEADNAYHRTLVGKVIMLNEEDRLMIGQMTGNPETKALYIQLSKDLVPALAERVSEFFDVVKADYVPVGEYIPLSTKNILYFPVSAGKLYSVRCPINQNLS